MASRRDKPPSKFHQLFTDPTGRTDTLGIPLVFGHLPVGQLFGPYANQNER
jgi:hypothetical protein